MPKTILISAGHSETDPGAVSKLFKEADLAVILRDKVASLLRAKSISVLTDGADGINDPLNKAISLAKTVNGPAVEIHFNAGAPSANGIEALCKPNNKPIAQALCQAIAKETLFKLRGDFGYKPDDSGQHHRLGFCEAGGIILEVCFISNDNDMNAYISRVDKVAAAIAGVLANFSH